MLTVFYELTQRNEETGLSGFMVEPQESCAYVTDGLLPCIGRIGLYENGTPIEIEGEWTGDVFEVKHCEIPRHNVYPVISKYLSEGLCKRFIKSMGKRSIEEFIMESNAKAILGKHYDKVKALYESETVSNWLLSYGAPADRISYLIDEKLTKKMILSDLFDIMIRADMPIGITDHIAKDNHISSYDSQRITGWIKSCVRSYINAGNTVVEVTKLTKLINYRLKDSSYPETKVSVSMVIAKAVSEPLLAVEYKENKVYIGLTSIVDEERTIIENIKRLNQSIPRITHPVISDERANEEQRACYNALKTSGIKIITGPPGSGKTTVVKGLIEAFQKEYPRKRVKLCATTGQASKVLKREVGKSATTIHRMLSIRPFFKGKNFPELDADLIIADEMSMCGTQLFSYLLASIKSGAILLLIGDENQLQSVDYGNVLHDLIESGCFEVYRLQQVLRQTGDIYENAKKVNKGIKELVTSDIFEIKRFPNGEEMYKALDTDYKVGNGVVTPVKGGVTGVESLNALLQTKHQTGDLLLTYGERKYYRNDYIRMTATNYEKEYINGDTGRIRDYKDGIIRIEIDGHTIILSRSDLRDMDLSYAITIHKSQGTETREINIMLPDNNMISRRLLYTAITRAKEKVLLYCENNAIEKAIDNVNEQVRETMLMEKIKALYSSGQM